MGVQMRQSLCRAALFMSKLITYIAVVCFFSLEAHGQKDSTFFERQKKNVQVTFDSIPNVDSTNSQRPYTLFPTSWTNDYEHILTAQQINILDSVIAEFENKTTIEIAIVTVDSFFTTKETFDADITALGNSWGVGKKEEKNGIIIGISSSLKKIRITNGHGIESKLSDNETKKIIDEVMIPAFKQAHFFEGLQKGLLSLIEKLE